MSIYAQILRATTEVEIPHVVTASFRHFDDEPPKKGNRTTQLREDELSYIAENRHCMTVKQIALNLQRSEYPIRKELHKLNSEDEQMKPKPKQRADQPQYKTTQTGEIEVFEQGRLIAELTERRSKWIFRYAYEPIKASQLNDIAQKLNELNAEQRAEKAQENEK